MVLSNSPSWTIFASFKVPLFVRPARQSFVYPAWFIFHKMEENPKNGNVQKGEKCKKGRNAKKGEMRKRKKCEKGRNAKKEEMRKRKKCEIGKNAEKEKM
ncbi:hypothetical protein POVWA2_043470 [Plasmodium ovale wallikeri]|uniref:Uncharacterized protein n=1 Tax=Plasmodium ovale wallikeri TaxID=864142 RepID=A0A1A8ZE66_PLAOA|nr:hypothetical protein POVWA2_043470 [Plasmodium ovale wallikeri]